MKILNAIWTKIGNNNSQRFWRLMMLIWTCILAFNLAVNLGYDKTKGGWYWKPFDVSYHKGGN